MVPRNTGGATKNNFAKILLASSETTSCKENHSKIAVFSLYA